MSELYHHGVKGMKWGVINERRSSSAMERYQIKLDKRKRAASGDAANLKYMTDAERNTYTKGRIKTMGSKSKALKSETSNFVSKQLGTLGKGVLGTSISSLTVGLGTSIIASGAESVAYLLGGAAIGGIGGAVVTVGALTTTTITRGANYIKNMRSLSEHK